MLKIKDHIFLEHMSVYDDVSLRYEDEKKRMPHFITLGSIGRVQ